MATKTITFVRKLQNGSKEIIPMNEVEQTLRDWYGYQDCAEGFIQKAIDWYFEESDNTSVQYAKSIIKYVNESFWQNEIVLTIEQWLILEHTKYCVEK